MNAVLSLALLVQQDDKYGWVERAVKTTQERLKLTDEQVQQVIGKIKATLAEMDKVRESAQKDLKGILGEETYAKAQDDLARFLSGGPRGGGPGGGGFAGGIFSRATQNLGLTQEQQDKIKPITEEFQKKMREFFQSGANPQDAREKFRTEMESFGNKIKEVLTDEQKAKFDEAMRNFGQGFRRRQNNQ